jgi:hypothetical protein
VNETTRRNLITGLIAFIAAPAIVRAGSLMPVKQMLVSGPTLISPEWEEVKWIGTYRIHFDKDQSGNCTWELVRGPGFEEIVMPYSAVAMAA